MNYEPRATEQEQERSGRALIELAPSQPSATTRRRTTRRLHFQSERCASSCARAPSPLSADGGNGHDGAEAEARASVWGFVGCGVLC
eukprot:scaffold2260_cov134-Isochrysis_galbana.AAC.2